MIFWAQRRFTLGKQISKRTVTSRLELGDCRCSTDFLHQFTTLLILFIFHRLWNERLIILRHAADSRPITISKLDVDDGFGGDRLALFVRLFLLFGCYLIQLVVLSHPQRAFARLSIEAGDDLRRSFELETRLYCVKEYFWPLDAICVEVAFHSLNDHMVTSISLWLRARISVRVHGRARIGWARRLNTVLMGRLGIPNLVTRLTTLRIKIRLYGILAIATLGHFQHARELIGIVGLSALLSKLNLMQVARELRRLPQLVEHLFERGPLVRLNFFTTIFNIKIDDLMHLDARITIESEYFVLQMKWLLFKINPMDELFLRACERTHAVRKHPFRALHLIWAIRLGRVDVHDVAGETERCLVRFRACVRLVVWWCVTFRARLPRRLDRWLLALLKFELDGLYLSREWISAIGWLHGWDGALLLGRVNWTEIQALALDPVTCLFVPESLKFLPYS